jgi:magnesium-transporting ATPase (P-type)
MPGPAQRRGAAFAYLNSYYQTGLKNLLDRAVLEHVELHTRLRVAEDYRKVDEIPFDFERRRMSVVVAERDHHHELICKGAVEEILGVCTPARGRQHTSAGRGAAGPRAPRDARAQPRGPARGGRGHEGSAAAEERLRRGRRVGADPDRLRRLPRPAEGIHGQALAALAAHGVRSRC